jgi:hypothetical protein
MYDLGIISPAMFKVFEDCEGKFYYRYIEQISTPMLDRTFVVGKNIHALASYYLKGESIEKFESALKGVEVDYWNYLKSIEYFSYEILGVEKSISCKLGSFWIGGRLDGIVRNDKDLYILDYKTGGVKSDMVYDYQTMVYMVLCDNLFESYDSLSFVYIDLKNEKEVVIKYNQELKAEYEKRLIEGAQNMSDFKIENFRPSVECECEFSKICKRVVI